MTWVDAVVLAVLALSAVLAYLRGFVQEALGLAAWIGALVAAFAAMPHIVPYLRGTIEPDYVANAVAIAGVFLLVLVVLKILIGAIARRVQDSALGSVDRALGMAFGLARGAALVVIAYILASMVIPLEQWPPPVRESRSLPLAADGAAWLVQRLPEGLRPRVAPPPARPVPTQDDLMRPPPRARI